jgi:hypothetical protein
MRLISSEPAIEGISKNLQPVVIVDDLSTIGQTVKVTLGQQGGNTGGNAPGSPSSGTVTAPGGGYPAQLPAGGANGLGYMCQFFQDEGAAGALDYRYTITCPAGQFQRWWAISFWKEHKTAGVFNASFEVNPLGTLSTAGTFDAGRLQYANWQLGFSANKQGASFVDPLNPRATQPFPYPTTAGVFTGQVITNYDGTFPFLAPIWLAPGGQLDIVYHATTTAITRLVTAGMFSVYYI